MALLSDRIDPTPTDFVGALVALERNSAAIGAPVRVTWLNHHSIGIVLAEAAPLLAELDVCGVDGQFLKLILRHPVRTSADLVVPLLLRADESVRTVLAIGGRGKRGEALTDALSRCAGRTVQVHAMDGFDGLRRGEDLRALVRELEPDMLLVGLGAGLQEQVLVEGARAMGRGYAMTCGGFLDQVLQPGYYPSWAYPLRLNWLVRLAREPRRLWHRYTVGALLGVAQSRSWRRTMAGVPGVQAHARMCATGASAVRVARDGAAHALPDAAPGVVPGRTVPGRTRAATVAVSSRTRSISPGVSRLR